MLQAEETTGAKVLGQQAHVFMTEQRGRGAGVEGDFSSNEGIDTLLGMRPSWLLQTCFGERPCSVMIQRILFRCQKCLGLDEKNHTIPHIWRISITKSDVDFSLQC